MRPRFKATLLFLLDPRSLIFAFALFNFLLIWTKAREGGGIACLVCPWYYPWRWVNEPTLLLLGSLLLRLNRALGCVVALILSGYLVGYFVRLYIISHATLLQEWKYLRKFDPYIVGSWDSQYLFALVILCCSIFYLAGAILRRRALHRTADNKSLDASGGSQVFYLICLAVLGLILAVAATPNLCFY